MSADQPTRYGVDVRMYRDALRDAVELPITTRGVLYVLAQWMNKDGSNARPRLSRLAASCQLRQRAVAKHLSAAVEAGYLYRTSSGHKGRTAVYRACIPACRWDAKAGTLVQPLVIEEPSQRVRDDAGYDGKGCTVEPQRVHADDIKGCTSVQPDLGTTTSLLLHRSGGRAASRGGLASQQGRHDDHPAFDEDRDDPDAWLDANLFGLAIDEESIIRGMLDKGCHPRAIYNTIVKRRDMGA